MKKKENFDNVSKKLIDKSYIPQIYHKIPLLEKFFVDFIDV